MKLGLMIILIAGIIIFLAHGDGGFSAVCNAETNSITDRDCIYISTPSFNVSEFFGGRALNEETDRTDSNTKSEEPINIDYETVEKEISNYVESTIPESQELFSSTDLLIGEIARADVKMTVSPLRFSTCDKMSEPAIEAIVPDEIIVAKADIPTTETSMFEEAEKFFENAPIPPSDNDNATKTETLKNEALTPTALFEPVKTVIEKQSNKVETEIAFSEEIEKLQKIWSSDPKQCIELATELLAAGDLIPLADQAEIWYRKGRSHRIMGEPLSAIEAHRMAAELAPDCDSYLNGYAWILSTVRPSKYRNQQLALIKAREAVNLSNRGTANYLDTLARILNLTGEPEEAFEVQKEAVQLAPGRKSFRNRLKQYEATILAAD
jgi:tetratricopeptide (TPR) repeat protein